MKATFFALIAAFLLTSCGATPGSDADTHKDTNIHSMDNSHTVGSCNMAERRKAQCR